MKQSLFHIRSAVVTAVTLSAVLFTGCQEPEPDPAPTPVTVAVTGVSLNKTTLTLEEEDSEALTAAVSPDNASNKAISWKTSDTAVATAIDIKAKYDAKCGALSVGSPKVFFKYFYINTATGEKSGEVLAQAKLSE